ncbi:MAG: caspase domain-containing protein [Spirulinaceae cyanobacterium]
MANYSSLTIGINRYEHTQPLNFAQADAQAIWQYMVGDAKVPPSQSLLLTDASAWVEDRSTTPTQENILRWLTPENSSQIQPWLWFFFSGYGVSWQGQDYLLPIDGDPTDIPNTGILIETVFEQLRGQQADNILVLLDINRSPGILAEEAVGGDTLELAKKYGIAVVLSSQLTETSHESTGLGHGMFAAALLEALRYYQRDVTLDKLEQYLRDRVPELSEHHWRPKQEPLFAIPATVDRALPILPSETLDWEMAGVSTAVLENHNGNGNGKATAAKITTSAPIVRPNQPLVPPNLPVKPENGDLDPSTPESGSNEPEPAPASTPDRPPAFQKWLAVGGGLFILLMLLGWLLNNLPGGEVSDPVVIEDGTGESEQPPLAVTESPIAPDATSTSPETPQTTPVSPAADQEGQEILVRARSYIRNYQASELKRAIEAARQVPENSRYYPEAQRTITTWSLMIIDIARGRANNGDFKGAIAAAALIDSTEDRIHKLANQRIEQWKRQLLQQEKNQSTIRAAKQLIRFTQASSYSKGIVTLRQVPVGQPGYAEARKLINIWSRQIYLIANSRAARGDLAQAIETAKLVPQDTPSYQAAQDAIARWQ